MIEMTPQMKVDVARARALGMLLGLVEYKLIPDYHMEQALDILREYEEGVKEGAI